MQNASRNKLALVAVLALVAISAFAGHPLPGLDLLAGLSPQGALAGLAFAPMVLGETDFGTIEALLRKQGDAFEEFKGRYNQRFANLEDAVNEVLIKSNRPGAPWNGGFSREDGEYKQAFLRHLRTGAPLDRKAMSTGSDPDGGVLVPKQIDSEISKALREVSPMRQVARVIPVESGDFSMMHSTGGTGYAWVGETETRSETNTPQLQEITPPMGEIYAMPKVTQRLLDDNTFDLENWLQEEVVEAFGTGEGDAFQNGNGINKPRGILTYSTDSAADGTRAENKLQYVASGQTGAFASANPFDKLVKLVHALKAPYRAGAVFLMNTNTLETVRYLKDGNGNYIWSADGTAGTPGTLLGYPVYEDAAMPDVAANSLSIAFGNFRRGYVIVDRITQMLRDPFTAKPYVSFYTTRRVGGCVRDFRAIKLMKFAAS